MRPYWAQVKLTFRVASLPYLTNGSTIHGSTNTTEERFYESRFNVFQN